jgi:hypothetical protein
MSGGDTLVLKNGTYHGSSFAILEPPSGTLSNYTIIKAENDFQAIINGKNQSVALEVTGKSYIKIEGLKIKNTQRAIQINDSHHLKVMRVTIKNGTQYQERYGNVVNLDFGSHHVLLEDVWISGNMRYGIIVSRDCYNVILRRCVVRWDGNGEREPKSGICFYGAVNGKGGASDCMAQNCLAIDFNSGPLSGIQTVWDVKNIKIYGCIALNSRGIIFDARYETGRAWQVQNSLVWDSFGGRYGHGFAMRDSDPSSITLFNQITAGNNDGKGAYCYGSGGAVTVKNSLFLNNGNSNYGISSHYNIYVPAAHAQGTNQSTLDPVLKYIMQTTDTGTGEGGVKRGATIMRRYGISGTLWGEPGYDQLTDEPLWPWPYEDQIKADFAEADEFTYPKTKWDGSPVGSPNDPDRGFAAVGQTLTNYIWGYLGNTAPPMNVKAIPGNQQITLWWDPPAPVAFPTITAYNIYEVTGGTPVMVGTVSGNTTYTNTITGLTNGSTYKFVVTAVDGLKGESGYSYEVYAAPGANQAGITSPRWKTPAFTIHY